ncbi:hypothetical protein [Achromobacter spanius]|nr:hypothetical protein [Achromobacter spanius]
MNFFEIVGMITTTVGLFGAVMWATGILTLDIEIQVDRGDKS